MHPSDRDALGKGDIIPFQPRKDKSKSVRTSTLAALIAVTVLHDESMSAEDKLLDLIEGSGEMELLDGAEALALLEETSIDAPPITLPKAANDNSQT